MILTQRCESMGKIIKQQDEALVGSDSMLWSETHALSAL